MIELSEHFPAEPGDFAAHTREARDAVQAIVDSGGDPTSQQFKNRWGDYKHVWAGAQHRSKCAYCETRCGAAYPGDVEHYRPKARIREPRTRGNRDDTGGRSPRRRWHTPSRPGYWWLAYDWTNYVFSCNKCNTWKADRFPLPDPRGTMQPGVEAQERPQLLDPYVEDPETHLSYDEVGRIHGTTPRGTATIDICGLDRRSLEIEREMVARRLLLLCDDYTDALVANADRARRNALRAILEYSRPAENYAGMCRHLTQQRIQLSYSELLQLERRGFP